MLQINSKLKSLFSGILKEYSKKEDLEIVYEELGVSNNTDITINLKNKKISDFDFLVVESGWGYFKATCSIPTSIFMLRNESYKQCYLSAPVYGGGTNYVSLNYINNSSFRVNGAIGTDVLILFMVQK